MRAGHSQPHLSQCIADEIISSTFSVFVGLNCEFHHRHRQSGDSRDDFWQFTILQFSYILFNCHTCPSPNFPASRNLSFQTQFHHVSHPKQRASSNVATRPAKSPANENLTRVSNEKWFSLGVLFFPSHMLCSHLIHYFVLRHSESPPSPNLSPRIHSLAW